MVPAAVRYLSHLIGHESAGSILSALKARRWANGLSAGNYLSNSDFACFSVSVELSDEGVLHVPEVVDCVFAYIGEHPSLILHFSLPPFLPSFLPSLLKSSV